MTRTEVKQRRKQIEAELKQAQAAVKFVQAKLRGLYNVCEHPKAGHTSH